MALFDGLPDVFTGAFGQTVRVLPAYGAGRDIQAIFRRPSESDLFEPGAVSTQTELHARTADVGDIRHGDAIKVNGTTYRAGTLVPDDKGMTRITLMADD